MKQKCPYIDCCTLYDKTSATCNETGGDYNGPGRMAGCGRELQSKGKKAYCWKQPQKIMISPSYKQQMIERRKAVNKSTNWKWVAIGLVGLTLFFTGRMIYLLLTNYT